MNVNVITQYIFWPCIQFVAFLFIGFYCDVLAYFEKKVNINHNYFRALYFSYGRFVLKIKFNVLSFIRMTKLYMSIIWFVFFSLITTTVVNSHLATLIWSAWRKIFDNCKNLISPEAQWKQMLIWSQERQKTAYLRIGSFPEQSQPLEKGHYFARQYSWPSAITRLFFTKSK